MSELLTLQDLANGHLDVKALGEAANGDENTIVTTRTGNTYPSAERAINIMFQNGGLPVKPFATLAQMNTEGVSLADGQLAQVYNETANNGLYVKAAEAWVKSSYDPVNQSKAYTNTNSAETLINARADIKRETSKIAAQSTLPMLHAFADVESYVYSYYDQDAELMLLGLDNSVQHEIKQAKSQQELLKSNPKTDLFTWIDDGGAVVAVIDADSKLQLTGLDKSVQDYLLNINLADLPFTAPKSYRTKADLFNSDVNSALQQAPNSAPIGSGLLQQNYHVGKDWVNNLSMSPSPNRIVVAGYNDKGTKAVLVPSIGVVHPNVIAFDKPIMGYKHWMGINPYTGGGEDYELPYIYGSNSDALDAWELIPGLPQPFDVDPPDTDGVVSGHLSDSAFTYDPINGELWFFWRQTRYYDIPRSRNLATNTFVGRSTKDGTTWSDIKVILPTYTINDDLKLSPSIIYNAKDGLFYMYYINLNGSMSYMTTSSLNSPNWIKVGDVSLPFKGWHLETKWVGDALVALIHSDEVDQLYVGISYDMKTWSFGKGLFNAPLNLYKSSFLPVFNDNDEISLKVVYTSDQNSTPDWGLFTTQTNFTSIKDL